MGRKFVQISVLLNKLTKNCKQSLLFLYTYIIIIYMKTVLIKEDIVSRNNERAKEVREVLRREHIFYINVMSSPGAGKTTLLTGLINALKEELAAGGIEPLFAELTRVDPEYAAKIHPNNTVRVLRALEIFRSCGLTPTGQAALSHRESSPYRPLYIGLGFRDRAVLYGRIDARVDGMVANGLVREAAAFYAASPAETAANAIGCKELKPYLDGEQSLEVCVDSLKRATRRYAKRQLTWFGRWADCLRIRWAGEPDFEAARQTSTAFLTGRGYAVCV